MYATCLGSPFSRCCKKCQIKFNACKLQLPGYIVAQPKSLTNFVSCRPSCIAPFFMSGCQKLTKAEWGQVWLWVDSLASWPPKKRGSKIFIQLKTFAKILFLPISRRCTFETSKMFLKFMLLLRGHMIDPHRLEDFPAVFFIIFVFDICHATQLTLLKNTNTKLWK